MPAILALGMITGYDDIKHGKIRNKWIILSLAYALIVYSMLFALNLFPAELNLSYFLKLIINLVIVVCISFGAWYFGIWTAGDGKLFIAFFSMIPLSVYNLSYAGEIPAVTILINIFVPLFFYYSFVLLFRTTYNQKLDALKKNLEIKRLGKSFISLFAVFWIVNLASLLLIKQSNYFVDVFIAVLLFGYIQRHFNKIFFIFALVVSLIRLIVDPSIYSLNFLGKIAILFFFWILFRSFILELGKNIFIKNISIKKLKKGMLPAEPVLDETKKSPISFFRIESRLFDYTPEGLTENEVKKIKNTKIKDMMIQQTIPFAQFIFLGVILTIISKGNILIWVGLILSWG